MPCGCEVHVVGCDHGKGSSLFSTIRKESKSSDPVVDSFLRVDDGSSDSAIQLLVYEEKNMVSANKRNYHDDRNSNGSN